MTGKFFRSFFIIRKLNGARSKRNAWLIRTKEVAGHYLQSNTSGISIYILIV